MPARVGLVGRLLALLQATWLRWVLVIVVLALYAGWITYVVKADKPVDFFVYYLAAGAFQRGQNAYDIQDEAWDDLALEMGVTNYTRPYRYPPLTAQIAAPLTALEPPVAAALWLALSAIASVTAAWLLALTLDQTYRWVIALGALLFFVPPLTTLHAGQVNLLLLASLAAALLALRRRKPLLGGAALAVGAGLKVIPLALVAYLLWCRRWKALLAAVLVLIVLLLLGTFLVGWEGLAAYGRNAVQLGEPGRLFPEPTNQSLHGFFARLFTRHSYGWSLADDAGLARTAGMVAALVLVLATAAVCWRVGNTEALLPLEFSLIVTALQLITPFTWYHQLSLLLIPIVVLAGEAWRERKLRWMLIPLTVGYVTIDLHGLLWHHLRGLTLLQSTPIYAMVAMWMMLAWLIVSRKRAIASG